MITKPCPKCKKIKPLSGFYKHRQESHKYYTPCRECVLQKGRRWRNSLSDEEREEYKKRKRISKTARRGIDAESAYKILSAGTEIKCNKHDVWNCCGDPYDRRILTIDHIKDDGHLDRSKNGDKRGSHQIYRDIIKHPRIAKRRFQILCMNAQWIKRGEMYRNKRIVI